MWLAFGSQTRELRDGELVVGSGADADWRIGTADLMPRHFTVTVYDLNASLRATSKDSVVVVNGRQLLGVPYLLNDGDMILAGGGRFCFSDQTPRTNLPPALSRPPAYLANDSSGRGRELISRSTMLGRDASVAIAIDDPSASRFHAEVRREAGGFALHSMGSSGTLLNSRKVSSPMVLSEGDVIEIAGRKWRFTHDAPAENPPPREAAGRDAATTREWRSRAAPTGTVDIIASPHRPTAKRTMALVAGGVILLMAIVGYLLATRA
ncbi:MAG TPA: FHA domain-containing protein [Gemmatimonadaceae bacterium]|jgi:predicted component of type VI protein secretion system